MKTAARRIGRRIQYEYGAAALRGVRARQRRGAGRCGFRVSLLVVLFLSLPAVVIRRIRAVRIDDLSVPRDRERSVWTTTPEPHLTDERPFRVRLLLVVEDASLL